MYVINSYLSKVLWWAEARPQYNDNAVNVMVYG